MKYLLSFLMFALFFLKICTAQNEAPTPPTPPSTETIRTSSSSSTTTINFNNGKNDKLKLRVDDTEFNMNLDFKNVKTAAIRRLIVKYLGNPKARLSRSEEWADDDKTYKIKLGKGHFKVFVNKEEWTKGDYQDFLTFSADILDELGWDINLSKY